MRVSTWRGLPARAVSALVEGDDDARWRWFGLLGNCEGGLSAVRVVYSHHDERTFDGAANPGPAITDAQYKALRKQDVGVVGVRHYRLTERGEQIVRDIEQARRAAAKQPRQLDLVGLGGEP